MSQRAVATMMQGDIPGSIISPGEQSMQADLVSDGTRDPGVAGEAPETTTSRELGKLGRESVTPDVNHKPLDTTTPGKGLCRVRITAWDTQTRTSIEGATMLRADENEGEGEGERPDPGRLLSHRRAKVDGPLSESEIAGLAFIASTARKWSLSQLTSYYQGLLSYGNDYQRISQQVDGKTAAQAEQYHRNWDRRHPPLQEWLRDFEVPSRSDAEPPSRGQLLPPGPPAPSLKTKGTVTKRHAQAGTQQEAGVTVSKRQRTTSAVGPVPGTLLASADTNDSSNDMASDATTTTAQTSLSATETAGLADIASRAKRWSLSQITACYEAMKLDSVRAGTGDSTPNFHAIAESVDGKSALDVQKYFSNWNRRYGVSMQQWVGSFGIVSASGSESEPSCAVCKRADLNKGVVCDGCKASYHLQCVAPSADPVDEPPEGDWFCPTCAVAEQPGQAEDEDTIDDSDQQHATQAPVSQLTALELVGLESIASRATSWRFDQLVAYYKVLKVCDADMKFGFGAPVFDTLVENVVGKTKQEIVTYYRNWARRYVPMEQWLRERRWIDGNSTPDDIARTMEAQADLPVQAEVAVTAASVSPMPILTGKPVKIDPESILQTQRPRTKTDRFVAEPRAVPKPGTPSSVKVRPALTATERAGLAFIASNAKAWSSEQLTSYYRALKAFGADFDLICKEVAKKSAFECKTYYHNWNRRYAPLPEWLRDFNKPPTLSDRAMATKCKLHPSAPTTTSQPMSPSEPRRLESDTVVELSESEQLGLRELAAHRNMSWSYDELETYYVALQTYGPDLTKITEALAGSKTRKQVANYHSKWEERSGKTMVEWLGAYKAPNDLSTTEIAGLADIARRANSWSHDQITQYYVAMKASDKKDVDFFAISEAVEGKTQTEVRKYFHNWNRRYRVSMTQWIRENQRLRQPNSKQRANGFTSPQNAGPKPSTEQSSKAMTLVVAPAVVEQPIEKESLTITNRIDLGAIVVSTPRVRIKPKRFDDDQPLARASSTQVGQKAKRQPDSTSATVSRQHNPSTVQTSTAQSTSVSSTIGALLGGEEVAGIKFQQATKLSNSERAGLNHVAGNSTAWSLTQLTGFYLALRAHGKDYAKISAAVQGKCREDCSIYYRDWHRRHPPMISFMQGFDPLVRPAHASRKVQRKAAPVKAPVLSTPHAELNRHKRLSSAERAGLAYHNTKSTAWSLTQLTEFYLALRAHGKDYAKISAAVPGKSHAEVAIYYRDWHRRHPPMLQYYTNFKLDDVTHREPGQIATPTKVPDNAEFQMPSVSNRDGFGLISPEKATTAAALAASVNLSSSERLGLEFLASREQEWNFEELVTYYQGLRVHGADFTQIATNFDDKSVFDVEVWYRTWNLSKPPMEEWLRDFICPTGFVSQMSPAVLQDDYNGCAEDDDDIDDEAGRFFSKSSHGVQNDSNAFSRSPSPPSTAGSPVALSALELLLQAAEIATKAAAGVKRPADDGTPTTWNEAELPLRKRPRCSIPAAAGGVVAHHFQSDYLAQVGEDGGEARGDEANTEPKEVGVDVERGLGKMHAVAAVSANAQPEWRPAKAQSKLLDQNWSVDTGGAEAAFDLCFKDVKDGSGFVKMYGRAVIVPVEEVRNAIKEERKRGRGAVFYVREGTVVGEADRGVMICARLTDGANSAYPAHGLRFHFNREAQCDLIIESNGMKQYRLLASM